MADSLISLDLGRTNERRGAVEQAHRHITSLIDLRRVRPGERLPSAAQLAQEIGVSRPAVLQAMKILGSQGRVIVRPGRGGNWVALQEADTLESRRARAWENRQQILQMAHLREMLEPGVARLLALRGMRAADLSHARRLTEQMAELTAGMVEEPPGLVEDYRALDTELHLLLARATGMPVIESFVVMCRTEVAAAFDVMKVPPSRKRSSDTQHQELLDAIEAGDPSGAARVALEHITATTALLEAELADPTRTPAARRRARRTKGSRR